MKKTLLSAVLASGLFFGAAAVQAETIEFNWGNTGWFAEDVKDTYTGTFFVNNALDNAGVIIWTDFVAAWNYDAFDPFLAVWDLNGDLVGFNNDMNAFEPDAYINMGVMADGKYFFTIGNWPNQPASGDPLNNFAGAKLSDGFTCGTSCTYGQGLQPNVDNWAWNVKVSGVQAVPEPETWAMLLAGLGIVGAVARRRKLH